MALVDDGHLGPGLGKESDARAGCRVAHRDLGVVELPLGVGAFVRQVCNTLDAVLGQEEDSQLLIGV